jgi:hypothetical protein
MSPKQTMNKYFEMEVRLIGPKPKVWRRFLIHKYSTFDHLHKAIQAACGWQDYHLYSFSDENPYTSDFGDNLTFAISPHDLAENYQPEPEYAENLRLGHIFSDKSIGREIFYLYDYGDGWIHSVKMTGIHKFEEKFRRKLLAGERAFPLEDSGSLPGYQRCIDAYRDPKNAEEDLLVWMGDWNPEHFDLKKTQAMFESTRKKSADLGMSVEEAVELDEPQNKTVHSNVIDLRAKLARNR